MDRLLALLAGVILFLVLISYFSIWRAIRQIKKDIEEMEERIDRLA